MGIHNLTPDTKNSIAHFNRGKDEQQSDVLFWGLVSDSNGNETIQPFVVGLNDTAVPAREYGHGWELSCVTTNIDHVESLGEWHFEEGNENLDRELAQRRKKR